MSDKSSKPTQRKKDLIRNDELTDKAQTSKQSTSMPELLTSQINSLANTMYFIKYLSDQCTSIYQLHLQQKVEHKKAEILKQQISSQHAYKMQQLDYSHDAFKTTISAIEHSEAQIKDSMDTLDAQISKLIGDIAQPSLSIDEKLVCTKVLNNLQKQKMQLLNSQQLTNDQIITAFVHSSHTLREQPRTLTDVTYVKETD